jgi:Cu-Zn family superoxide dismutase
MTIVRLAPYLFFVPLLAAFGGSAPADPQAAPTQPGGLARIELPATVSFPEGVAYDAASGSLYTGSASDGTIVRVNASTGAANVVAAAGRLVPAGTTIFPTVVGMETDDRQQLWIAGGRTGKAWIVSVTDGRVIREATVPSVGTSLINDVALVGGAGYFTDTTVPTLWRLSADGVMEPWLDLRGTPIPYEQGAKLNGITVTPDGKRLIVIHMGLGRLFTIDLASKAIAAIDTAGADLTGADGLVLNGDLLYVVRQTAVEIATVRLSADLASGTVVARFKDPALAWPATAVKVGEELIVVNTQFNTRQNNTTTRPFTLLRVPLSRLAGG